MDVINIIQEAINRSLKDDIGKRIQSGGEKRKRGGGGSIGNDMPKVSDQVVKYRRRASIPNSLLPPPPVFPTDLTTLTALAFQCKSRVYMDTQRLYPLLKPLEELNSMIGLKGLNM